MVEGWLKLGQPYAAFWQITLREYEMITGALIAEKEAGITAQRQLNQELATLMSFAFHNPKKMPDFTKSAKRNTQPAMGEADAAKALRSALVGLHFRSRKD